MQTIFELNLWQQCTLSTCHFMFISTRAVPQLQLDISKEQHHYHFETFSSLSWIILMSILIACWILHCRLSSTQSTITGWVCLSFPVEPQTPTATTKTSESTMAPKSQKHEERCSFLLHIWEGVGLSKAIEFLGWKQFRGFQIPLIAFLFSNDLCHLSPHMITSFKQLNGSDVSHQWSIHPRSRTYWCVAKDWNS